tara:strand:+ start:2249 stop:2794 length:546 start_codon:yes stop_codon:yes gene_type:complete
MATNTIELTGTLEWAKLFESNRDNGEYDVETDGATTVTLLMEDDVFKAMKDSGVRKQGKPDPEGRGTRVTFKRPWKDRFDREWAAGPPVVYTPAGSVWSEDGDGLIGNGSVGVVYLDVYDTKMGKGCRLNGVQVIDHVVFEGGGGGGGGVKPRDYTQGQPAASPAKAAPPSAKIAPGDIPF